MRLISMYLDESLSTKSWSCCCDMPGMRNRYNFRFDKFLPQIDNSALEFLRQFRHMKNASLERCI